MEPNNYDGWTPGQLIQRIKELEASVHSQRPSSLPSGPGSTPLESSEKSLSYRKPPKAPPRPFDFSKYTTRLIALKFAYLGQQYNGFEHHKNNKTPLPTIEEEIWKALVKTRLIDSIPTSQGGKDAKDDGPSRVNQKDLWATEREHADVNWEGCEYSKCGRTDRGVSAFGQVIGVRVRSNRPLPKPAPPAPEQEESVAEETQEPDMEKESQEAEEPFDPITDELPYIQLLNRVLPPDIRILAWCPNPPPEFSARFHCKERRYKYFFTNPCFTPVPGSSGVYKSIGAELREGWLDIEAMRQGCKNLVGLHDFRNFCKIDPSKQLTSFNRRIFHADIEEVSPLDVPSFLSSPAVGQPSTQPVQAQPAMYAFVVHGSAFLWHQVRSLVAILFRIGQGLESPDLIKELLDIEKNPCRPRYEMASDAPLVLWDCVFPAPEEVRSAEERETGYVDALEWIFVGERGGEERTGKGGVGRGKWGRGGIMDDVWEVWRKKKIEETLSASLMDIVARQGKGVHEDETEAAGPMDRGVRVFDGADYGRSKGKYTKVMNLGRMDPVEVVNAQYARRKGWDPAQPKVVDEDADE